MSLYLPIMQYGFLFTTCVLGSGISIEREDISSSDSSNSNDQDVEMIIIEDKQKNSAPVKDDNSSNNNSHASSSQNPNVYNCSEYVPEEENLNLEEDSFYRIDRTTEENIESDYKILENRPWSMFNYLEGHGNRLSDLKNSCGSKEEYNKELNMVQDKLDPLVKFLYDHFKANLEGFSQIYKYLMTKPRQSSDTEELKNDLIEFSERMQKSHSSYIKFFDKASEIIKTHMEFVDAEDISNLFKILTDAEAEHVKTFEVFKLSMNMCETSNE